MHDTMFQYDKDFDENLAWLTEKTEGKKIFGRKALSKTVFK